MKIAITGASGFVGRNVSSKLLNQGEEVIAITRDASRIENINSFKSIFEMDITCPPKKCFEKNLIHL